MVSEDQGGFFYRKIEDPALARGGLFGMYVKDRCPFRMLQVQRIEHSIGNVQQALTVRSDGQRDVSRRVSESGDSADTWHDRRLAFDQGYTLLERTQVPAGRHCHDRRSFRRGFVGIPELPLLPRDEVVGVGENEPSRLVQRAAYVIRVGVGDDDRIALGRLKARSPQVFEQQARNGRRVVEAGEHLGRVCSQVARPRV
jgi:hypothetical protein